VFSPAGGRLRHLHRQKLKKSSSHLPIRGLPYIRKIRAIMNSNSPAIRNPLSHSWIHFNEAPGRSAQKWQEIRRLSPWRLLFRHPLIPWIALNPLSLKAMEISPRAPQEENPDV